MKHRTVKPATYFKAVCAAICLLVLCGCAAGETRSLLWYQDVFTETTVETDGRCWLVTRLPDGFAASLTAPETVSGITFTVAGGVQTVSAGNVTIPVSDALTGGCTRIFALFQLSEEHLTGVDAGHENDPDNAVYAHYRVGTVEYTVGIGGDGLPVFFEEERGGVRTRYEVRAITCGA